MGRILLLVFVLGLVGIACGQADSYPLDNTPTVPSIGSNADEVVGVFHRSGGFAGDTSKLVVYADGTVNAPDADFRVPLSVVRPLQQIFASGEWQGLGVHYGGEPLPDHFDYTIEGGGKRVFARQDSTPDVFEDAVNHFETLLFLSACVQSSKYREARTARASPTDNRRTTRVVATQTTSCLVGKPETTVVYVDGTVDLLQGDRNGVVYKTAKMPRARTQRLRDLLSSSEWPQLEDSYGKPEPNDMTYTIVARDKQVRSYGESAAPLILGQVLGSLDAINVYARQAAGAGAGKPGDEAATPATTTTTSEPVRSAPTPNSEWLSLTGEEARRFDLPDDVKIVWKANDAKFGLVQTRYQQVVAGAEVRGGQITVTRNNKGEQELVSGSYYPNL